MEHEDTRPAWEMENRHGTGERDAGGQEKGAEDGTRAKWYGLDTENTRQGQI